MSRIKLYIHSGFYFYLASLVLLLPFSWLMAVLAASALHEAGHWAAIKILRVPIHAISLEPGTARIICPQMSGKQEFFAAMAGPAVGILLIFVFPMFPKLAVCALVQSAFNLLPVFPFDGGRMLRCILGQGRSSTISLYVAYTIALVFICISIILIKHSIFAAVLCFMIGIRCFNSCKPQA